MAASDHEAVLRRADPALVRFLRHSVGTLVAWDVLQYLHHSPHALEGAVQIADALGRDREPVAAALTELSHRGLLQTRQMGSEVRYTLTAEPSIRAEIERFMRACDNARFRGAAVQYLMQSGAVGM